MGGYRTVFGAGEASTWWRNSKNRQSRADNVDGSDAHAIEWKLYKCEPTTGGRGHYTWDGDQRHYEPNTSVRATAGL